MQYPFERLDESQARRAARAVRRMSLKEKRAARRAAGWLKRRFVRETIVPIPNTSLRL